MKGTSGGGGAVGPDYSLPSCLITSPAVLFINNIRLLLSPVVKLEPVLGPGAAARVSYARLPRTPWAHACRGDPGHFRSLAAAVLSVTWDDKDFHYIEFTLVLSYTTILS